MFSETPDATIGDEGKDRISKFHARMSSYATSHQTLVVADMCFLNSFFFWKRKERIHYLLLIY
jgi:hypothetical protein